MRPDLHCIWKLAEGVDFRSSGLFWSVVMVFSTGMDTKIRPVADFYERYPISSEKILARLRAARGHLDNVTPDELFRYDQDHFGGVPANDALAGCAQIAKGSCVVDFCALLCAPLRCRCNWHRVDAEQGQGGGRVDAPGGSTE